MSAATLTRFTCDCTGCPATVEAPGNKYDFEIGRAPMPPGWHVGEGRFSGRRVVACPEHATELRDAERAMYVWECREVEARNAWVRANPLPLPPAWIDPAARPRSKSPGKGEGKKA